MKAVSMILEAVAGLFAVSAAWADGSTPQEVIRSLVGHYSGVACPASADATTLAKLQFMRVGKSITAICLDANTLSK